jgi:hypothetical protein
MILGLAGADSRDAVISMYFIALFFATFSFDLQILGFEKLQKYKRENFIILVSATRILGIGIICATFHFLKKWSYFICIEVALLAVFIGLFIKYTHESPHYVLANTGSQDHCKYILNYIANFNDEETITDKVAIGFSEQQITSRRSVIFRLKNLFN